MSDRLVSLDAVIAAINEGFLTRSELRRKIMLLSPAEQEMSAVEYERISRRFSDWCASTLCAECSFFDDCPQTNPDVLRELTPEQYVAAIQKWAREHPEKKRKTYAEDFFEKFPKAPHSIRDGKITDRPATCRSSVYGWGLKCSTVHDCAACWNEEMEGEDE